MKWLPRKKSVSLSKEPVTAEVTESRQQLKDVRSKWPEINGLVGRLARMNEDNHYSQLILEAFQGGNE